MVEKGSLSCPCSSGKNYQDCCSPFHEGKKDPNPLELMRSRYSAYAKNLVQYVIDSTHPANPQYRDDLEDWKKELNEFTSSYDFKKLEIHDFSENGPLSSVTFTAYIEEDNSDHIFTEKSIFERYRGKWLYKLGELAQGRIPDLGTSYSISNLLPIQYIDSPILRQKASFVVKIDDSLKELVEKMILTMDAYRAIGLAAPQVNHSLRVFVIRVPMLSKERKYIPGQPKVFINPKIISFGKEQIQIKEGCLSIPIIHHIVNRPNPITVEYTDLEGKVREETFSGLEAVTIQHEYDHLDGVLFIDRLQECEKKLIDPSIVHFEDRLKKYADK